MQLCDKSLSVTCAGRWFSPGTPVSSINKTASHDIIEILLKVMLNTITLTPKFVICFFLSGINGNVLSSILLWRILNYLKHH